MMIFTIITAPLWPAYTDAYAKNDYSWMIRTRIKMQNVFTSSVFLSIVMVIISPLFYKLWVGDKADVPFMMTLIVAFYVIAYCWMNLNGTLIVGMGKLKIQTSLCIAGMILHIPLSLLLSKVCGAYGVLISLTAITLFYAIVVNIQVNRILSKTATGWWLE